MIPVKAGQTDAAKLRMFWHLVGPDGITPVTGETGQPQISPNGAAFTATGIGALVEIGFGAYYSVLTSGAVATAGTVIRGRYKSANTAECPAHELVRVVAYDPDDAVALGLSAFALLSADIATLLDVIQTQFTLVRAKTDQLVFSLVGKVDAAIVDGNSFAQAAADKVWASTTRTITGAVDITVASAAAVWDYLTSALVTPGSVGELLVVTLDATVSSRATQASVDDLAATVGGDPLMNLVPGDYPSGSAGAALGRIGTGVIETTSPLSPDGLEMTVTRGDDYNADDARAFVWSDGENQWLDPIASATWTARSGLGRVVLSKEITVLVATGAGKSVRLELTSAETSTFRLGTPAYRFDVEILSTADRRDTPIKGKLFVLGDQTYA